MTPFFDLIRTKRAVRQFRSEPLPEDVIRSILDAGRLAGSAKNMQPWHFIAIQRRETLLALSRLGQWAGHLAGASLAVALATPDPFLRLSVPFDLGRAAQNMMLAAWASGVGSEMATIYRSEEARTVLGAPADVVIPWCISFGYPMEEQPRAPRKGGRRRFDEVVHREQW